MTKFTVTDTALKAGEPWGHAPIHVELVDSTGAAVSPAYVDATGVLVEAFDTVADGDGVFTLTLDSTADISPTGCFYLVRIGDADNIISGDDGDGTVRGLRASTPTVLGSTATFDGLADVNMAGKADGDVPTWDTTTGRYIPGTGGGGGGVSSVSGTAPITSTGGATPAIGITAATSGAAGSMSAADKSKLDGIESGATADQSAAELLTAIKTVDGTGSGLDADTVDGQHASAFEAAGTAAALVDDLSGVTDAATARTNLGLGGLATLSAVGASQITDGSITNDEINASAAIALSKLASISTARILGRTTSGSGAIEELAQSAVFGFLGTGTPGSGNFLRGDGTWSTATDSGAAQKANNLSDLANAKTARSNLSIPTPGRAAITGTNYYSTPGWIHSINTATVSWGVSANTLYHVPFIVEGDSITIDQLAFEITGAGGTTGLARIGLYSATTSWQPTGAALEDSGSIGIGSGNGGTGVKSYTISSPRTLNPGRYVLAWVCDTNCYVRVIQGSLRGGPVSTSLGVNAAWLSMTRSFTYGALPTAAEATPNFDKVNFYLFQFVRITDPSA